MNALIHIAQASERTAHAVCIADRSAQRGLVPIGPGGLGGEVSQDAATGDLDVFS